MDPGISEPTIREAGVADAGPVAEALAAAYGYFFVQAYDPLVLATALPIMIEPNLDLLASGRFALVQVGHEVVGCGGWSPTPPGIGSATPGHGHIRHVAVHPRWSGRGIGRLVYAWCEASASRSGICRFECWSSLNAEPFYAALGFTRVRCTTVMLRGTVPFPAVVMTRPIAAEA